MRIIDAKLYDTSKEQLNLPVCPLGTLDFMQFLRDRNSVKNKLWAFLKGAELQYLSVCLSVCPSVGHLSIHRFVLPSVCPPVCLSVLGILDNHTIFKCKNFLNFIYFIGSSSFVHISSHPSHLIKYRRLGYLFIVLKAYPCRTYWPWVLSLGRLVSPFVQEKENYCTIVFCLDPLESIWYIVGASK